jgi:hypothetical protein
MWPAGSSAGAGPIPLSREVVYFTPNRALPLCPLSCRATLEIPATCLRDLNVGKGLSMLYRFNRTRLGDWQAMDTALRNLVEGLLARPG